MASYFRDDHLLQPKTAQLVSDIKSLDHIKTESEIDALLLEANLVTKFLPKYNISLKDDKAYPYIEITWGDIVPQVKIVRRKNNAQSQYFGPFPVGTNLQPLMRLLRRVFPYVSQNHPGGKTCLRSHLGLCPCPDVYFDAKAKNHYKTDLCQLALFLDGKRQQVQKDLIKHMQTAAKAQNFEEANLYKYKLTQIDYLTAPRTQAWEYVTNPNLVEDKLEAETESLKHILHLTKLDRIECYDVATMSGKHNSGARVVIVNGVPEKRLYRHYKIAAKAAPNDVAMMQEMLTRRLKNKDDNLPDLIVLDGGLGQLGAAKEAMYQTKTNVPLISLAKQLETIYFPDGAKLNLELANPALHLLQKLSDEAHRFSRTYHFWQRRKSLLG